MNYRYFIAETKHDFDTYIRENDLSICQCRFINDHLQVAGLRDITINILGYGRPTLERQILQRFSHHSIKLRNI